MNNEPQGSGSEPQKELSRPSAKEIYIQVADNARDELKRSVLSLSISGFAGGIFIGFSGLGVAISTALLGPSAMSLFIAQMFYLSALSSSSLVEHSFSRKTPCIP
jgi:formate/nitrite transporter FocA (FNT family)